jgi:hypothetical protein
MIASGGLFAGGTRIFAVERTASGVGCPSSSTRSTSAGRCTSSLLIAEPMNSRFRRLPEGHVPDGAEQLRIRWRRFHQVRTLVAVAAFACLAAAVA